MTRKPARMYRKIEGQVYTRREYMGGVPALRVTQFDTGNLTRNFPLSLSLGTEEAAQVRALRRKVAELERTIEILSAATGFFARAHDPRLG